MKFAFSTVSCPAWEFPVIVSRAKEYGYDGVELRGFINEQVPIVADVFNSDAGGDQATVPGRGNRHCMPVEFDRDDRP